LQEGAMSGKDRVLIEGLEVRTVIGIYDWEREIRQTVRLDLEMAWDVSAAARSDDINDALDYKAVSKRLISFVEASSFGLIEALAENCAQIVLEEFSVSWLRLKMSKPGAVRGSENVAVLIERGGLD
jgi:dihydroneopterin aldolase